MFHCGDDSRRIRLSADAGVRGAATATSARRTSPSGPSASRRGGIGGRSAPAAGRRFGVCDACLLIAAPGIGAVAESCRRRRLGAGSGRGRSSRGLAFGGCGATRAREPTVGGRDLGTRDLSDDNDAASAVWSIIELLSRRVEVRTRSAEYHTNGISDVETILFYCAPRPVPASSPPAISTSVLTVYVLLKNRRRRRSPPARLAGDPAVLRSTTRRNPTHRLMMCVVLRSPTSASATHSGLRVPNTNDPASSYASLRRRFGDEAGAVRRPCILPQLRNERDLSAP